ncbi:hypothetical protein INT50_01795 [Vibrio diabolicus]|uniref:hypothetical protein n=1 Tax=Vibrio TaxID=662 RepID=UPI0013E0DAB1|nr:MULTISPECIES: hypothetical protein [Vibrio]HBC3491339.1 hypothetical protein [Vibrio alginolyticus]EGR2204622.1 hypothetical protein [Vibrio parahaemolyticus]MCC3817986.1 hypothetical protein [Vibrio parahaemolyticus]MCC3854650.1 hypothetical protein [Vibrio parahaemolyticus]MCR9308275.1 hypothetical protein [Vibrio diabolicus]
MSKRKLKLKCKHVTKNTESILEAEYETDKQVDQSSRKSGLVSGSFPVIVAVVTFIKEIIDYF